MEWVSLEAQWFKKKEKEKKKIHFPVQETQVRSLIQEDSTCCRTTRPRHHNC